MGELTILGCVELFWIGKTVLSRDACTEDDKQLLFLE